MNAPIGVLGLGSIGLRHARNLRALGRPVLGYDPDPQRRAGLSELGGRASTERAAVLTESAAVIIASPNPCHLADLTDALAAGRPVLVEKPLAHSDHGLEPLLEQAEHRGLTVFAGLNLRYHPTVRRARQWLAAGALGTPLWARALFCDYLPRWRPHQDHRQGYAADPATGGVIFDVIHELDLLNHLLGPARTVAAAARSSGTLGIAAEDCADLILAHEGGVLSSLHLDYVTRPRRRVSEIAGTGGVLTLDLDARRLTLTGPEGQVLQEQSDGGTAADDYVSEMTAFLECLEGRDTPACDGREALGVLRQALAARALAGLPRETART